MAYIRRFNIWARSGLSGFIGEVPFDELKVMTQSPRQSDEFNEDARTNISGQSSQLVSTLHLNVPQHLHTRRHFYGVIVPKCSIRVKDSKIWNRPKS